MRDDSKAAFRSLRSSKTFTTVALLVLALGIGASTAIFSVVDAVVLRGLPFDEHDRLVAVGERRSPNATVRPGSAPPDPQAVSSSAPQNYMDWAKQQTVFESMAAIAGGAFTLREPGAEPEDLRGQRVTAGFFDVLRVRPAIGSAFSADNEVDGRHRVAVLSDGLWRRRFGGDPGIIGRAIPLEGGTYDVIGVMPADFEYPIGQLRPTELWVPYVVPETERIRNPNSRSIYLNSIARLKPGVTLEQAQGEMDRIAANLQATHPQWNKDNLAGIRPLRDHLVGARTKEWMLMLLGAVALVLLIACANVANLLLARASTREREVGIRAAMGASRWLLLRQLMVESIVLSLIGTALAVVLAWWGISVLKNAMPDGVPRIATIALDLRVLAVAGLLAIATGVLFGIVPALQLSRPDLSNALREGARGASAGRARQLMRSVLVVAEVALAVVLLVGAALFIGSFMTLMRINPGFDSDNVLTVQISPRFEPGTRADYGPQFEDIVSRISGTPGVEHASIISGGMPLGGSMSITTMTVPGGVKLEPSQDDGISIRRVTSAYHEALRVPLRDGRYFTPADRKGAPKAIIINESAAKKYFPNERAVGRVVRMNDEDWTVVGVVGDVYQSSLETEPRTEAYTPVTQSSVIFGELVIRTRNDPYEVLPAVKAAVLSVLPDVPLRNVRSMEEIIGRRIAQRRLNMLLLGLFGLLGLVISAVGIYGVMAYVVAQRTREIGVRMALGASRSRVISMVLVKATVMVAIGLIIGTLVAWGLRSSADSFLFRIQSSDWRVFVYAIGTLAAAALVASFIPARRASKVDPMIALRAD